MAGFSLNGMNPTNHLRTIHDTTQGASPTHVASRSSKHRHRRARHAVGLGGLAALGMLAAGCSSAESTSTTALSSPPSTSTTPNEPPSLTYAAPGAFAVGYREFTTTTTRGEPLTLRAWYPTGPRDGYSPTTITYTAPNKFSQDITPGKVITSVGAAVTDGKPAPTATPYPLVVFSHGYALSPIVYSALLEHYVSHGVIVLAPEHNEVFDPSANGFPTALIDRPLDIRRAIDFAETLNAPGADMAELIDMDNVAVVGHSYGGYTALAAAGARFDFAAYKDRCAQLPMEDPLRFFCDPIVPNEAEMAAYAGLEQTPSDLWPSLGDPRVTAVISMAGDAYLFDQRGLGELTVPVMAMGGTVDEGTPYTWGAEPTYQHAGSTHRALVTFPGAGHMLFLDPCDGMPWVENSVYRDPLCIDAVWGPDRPLDVVAHYSTGFLLDALTADSDARAVLAGEQPALDNVGYATTSQS
jgi:predicted dienelactone hydrolase